MLLEINERKKEILFKTGIFLFNDINFHDVFCFLCWRTKQIKGFLTNIKIFLVLGNYWVVIIFWG